MVRLVKLYPIKEPDENYRKELYKIYNSIVESKLEIKKKRNLLTYLFAWENWSWRVVGISVKALEEIQKNKITNELIDN